MRNRRSRRSHSAESRPRSPSSTANEMNIRVAQRQSFDPKALEGTPRRFRYTVCANKRGENERAWQADLANGQILIQLLQTLDCTTLYFKVAERFLPARFLSRIASPDFSAILAIVRARPLKKAVAYVRRGHANGKHAHSITQLRVPSVTA